MHCFFHEDSEVSEKQLPMFRGLSLSHIHDVQIWGWRFWFRDCLLLFFFCLVCKVVIVEVLHVQYVAIHNDNKNEVLSLINEDCQGIIVVDPKHVRSTSMRSSRTGPDFLRGFRNNQSSAGWTPLLLYAWDYYSDSVPSSSFRFFFLYRAPLLILPPPETSISLCACQVATHHLS